MAHVRPFRGIRYDAARHALPAVIAPPYDVISTEQQAIYHRRDQHNVLHLELGLPEGPDGHGQDRYQRAARLLEAWLSDGVLRQDRSLAVYVYEEHFDLASSHLQRRGVFTAVRLEPWSRGVILPHERTLPKPKADRLNLLRATHTQISPIYAFVDDPDHTLESWLSGIASKAPDTSFDLRSEHLDVIAHTHRLWVIPDPKKQVELSELLLPRQIFIADGHHRYETALTYQDERRTSSPSTDGQAWDDMLMLLVPSGDPGLKILPIHRVVRLVDPLARAAFVVALERRFDVQWIPIPQAIAMIAETPARVNEVVAKHRPTFGVLGIRPSSAAILTLREGADLTAQEVPNSSPAGRTLDVTVLHSIVFQSLLNLGPEQIASERYVTYVHDAEAAAGSLQQGADLVFLMRPTRVEQVRDVALAGDRMPQKSTYFYPKVPTGMVLYPED